MNADLDRLLDGLEDTRARTRALVGGIPDAALEEVHSPLMSPLVWDLAHIAAFEDLWLGRVLGGEPLLRGDLAQLYDAFETPRAARGDIPLLEAPATREYMDAVRERSVRLAARGGPRSAHLVELVLRHEQQHSETMLQTVELAHLDPALLPAPVAHGHGRLAPGADREWVTIPAGRAEVGAGPDGFAYDNERPRHGVELPAFRIARAPVTTATYLTFVEGGGYERREWWSREGWAWKEEYDIAGPGEWTDDGREWRAGEGLVPLDPARPVVHVSFHEAAAFARAHSARLPTEQEWERAATGADPAHANLDQVALGPAAPSETGAAPSGCLAMLGDVWEWTSSHFVAYPGFAPDPYREYSEPFFGPRFTVLRGCSWATRADVATVTFRNWDLPQRRQIFSGFRLAADA